MRFVYTALAPLLRDVSVLVAVAAPDQTRYRGPIVGLDLTEGNCSLTSPLKPPEATITAAVHGGFTVALDTCSPASYNGTGRRWEDVNSPKVACSCRDDYPAFTVLPGTPSSDYLRKF